VLITLRELNPKRIVLVFGCGGDRDRSKRPAMGAVAARLADRVVLTSDNPRSEDPQAILNEILAGMPTGCQPEVMPDRAEAIQKAVDEAGPGDIVLIAGKGHETFQETGSISVTFDDRQVAAHALELRAAREARRI
jgi:UDP-N-acetylmuramoyl-L-alanyl-D-glutamate--2,6-diaminopimelate ligase